MKIEFLSVFRFEETPYYVEHNELLTSDEVDQVVEYVMSSLATTFDAE